MVMKYRVIIEKGPKSYGACVPDLPGCIAVGTTRREVMNLMKEAIDFHLEGLLLQREPAPLPKARGPGRRE